MSQEERQCQRGSVSASSVHTARLPLFAHYCHFDRPHCTLSIWPPLHRLRHIVGDYFALRSRMWCIMTSKLSRETCHHNISPAGSLLFADLFFCWLRLANLQCNTCPELFCFAFRTLQWNFLQLRTHQHHHLTVPSEGLELVNKVNSEFRQHFKQHQ